MNSNEQFVKVLRSEVPVTLKVLKAFPAGDSHFKPHEKSQSAIQQAWNLVLGQIAIQQALNDEFTIPPNFPALPAQWSDLVDQFAKESSKTIKMLQEEVNDSHFKKPVQFPTGPGELSEFPKTDFLWFILFDNIHHRGQLAVYLRLVGGKLPSIYGPTADEPWF